MTTSVEHQRAWSSDHPYTPGTALSRQGGLRIGEELHEPGQWKDPHTQTARGSLTFKPKLAGRGLQGNIEHILTLPQDVFGLAIVNHRRRQQAHADVPDSKRLVYIGTDNFKAGRGSVKQMAALVPGGGSIAVITIPGQRNLDDRMAGVADYQRHPERFVRSAPKPPALPSEVWINKAVPLT